MFSPALNIIQSWTFKPVICLLLLVILLLPGSVFAADPSPPPSASVTPSSSPAASASPGPGIGSNNGVAAAGVSNYTPPIHTGYTLMNVVSNVAGCWAVDMPLTGGLALGAAQLGGAVGTTPPSTTGCPFFDGQGNLQISYRPGAGGGGALAGLSRVMVAMYAHPSLSSTEYLADVGRNLGIVKPALAQGIGVGGTGDVVLLPVLNLWKVFRNLAYLIFIVIFVFVGLMIMFRRRINPQTVISVQTALPGLIIGLVLVTFSYFLAALIVDLSYVGMSLVGFIFIQSGLANSLAPTSTGTGVDTAAITSLSTNANIFGIGWQFIHNTLLTGTLIPYFTNLFDITGVIAGNQAGAAQSQSLLTNMVTGNFAAALGQVGQGLVSAGLFGAGLLVTAILIIAVVIQIFRLLWKLVSAYITVLIFAIAGPLLITIGSVPGRGATITYWWKTLLANVLIFPTVFAVIMFAGMFLANVSGFNKALPLFNGIPTNILAAIIGYGIVLGSPAVPDLLKQAMGVKDITALQQAAFGGVAAGVGVIGAGAKQVASPLTTRRAAYREAVLRERYRKVAEDQGGQVRKGVSRWVRWLQPV